MILRDFGNLGFSVSQLGFGGMHFPEKEKNGQTVVDWDKTIAMIHRAAELGVNLIDSSPFYSRHRESESVIGEAVRGIKQKIYLQTKWPIFKGLEEGQTFRHWLDHSLNNFGCDCIDMYLLHDLKWEKFDEIGKDFLDMALKAKEEGVIKHVGFSSHDEPENIMKLIDLGEFECMTVQYNLFDRKNEQCIEYAASKGMAVVLMGPIGGGRLGGFMTGIEDVTPDHVKSSPELALRFVFNNPHVSCALSGMTTIEQVEENVKTACRPDTLSEEEIVTVSEAFDQLKELANLYCTGCRYCMPCPQKIRIPAVFNAVIHYNVYGLKDNARRIYRWSTHPDREGNKRDLSLCIECAQCEERCPQNIEIIKQLKQANELFEKDMQCQAK